MNRFVKAVALLSVIVLFLLGSLLITLFVMAPRTRRSFLCHWLHSISPVVLYILGIHFWTEAPENESLSEGTLIVANHVSYLDVLLISAVTPTVFVTSVEVKRSFFLGWITRAAGCVHVERRRRVSLSGDIDQIHELLIQGFNVVLFPEGTTSDGRGVLPFKKSLLAAAVSAQRKVLPLCLNYRFVDGRAVTKNEGDILFYYGQMRFLKQLYKILATEEVLAELVFLPSISVKADTSRKELSLAARKAIIQAHLSVYPQSAEVLAEEGLAVLV